MAISIRRPSLGKKVLLAAKGINIAHLQSSIMSIMVNLNEPLPSDSEASLQVFIKNDGRSPISSLHLELDTPAGVAIVNPGEVFGGGHRGLTVDKLRAGQSMKFKLGVRSHPDFKSGTLIFRLTDNSTRARIMELPIQLVTGRR